MRVWKLHHEELKRLPFRKHGATPCVAGPSSGVASLDSWLVDSSETGMYLGLEVTRGEKV